MPPGGGGKPKAHRKRQAGAKANKKAKKKEVSSCFPSASLPRPGGISTYQGEGGVCVVVMGWIGRDSDEEMDVYWCGRLTGGCVKEG